MRHIPEIENTNLLAITSQLLGKTRVINIPENAEYSFQDTLNVLLHAATSTTNSVESASNDLRMKTPYKNVPSGDSIHGYINTNSIDYIMSSFRLINKEIIKIGKLKGTCHDAAIDFHDIPYYGDRNTPGVRGIKPKNGTSWGHSFCSLDIIGETKLTLDVIDINGLEKNYRITYRINVAENKSNGNQYQDIVYGSGVFQFCYNLNSSYSNSKLCNCSQIK
jgi:hypothetical protein